MKTRSAKNKGRRLQNEVRDLLREMGRQFGLVDGDIEGRGMGQNGVDLILSPAALRVFPLSIECKNVEKLQVVPTFWEHYAKYASDSTTKLLIHSKNRTQPMVTMRLSDFMEMLKQTKGLPSQQQ